MRTTNERKPNASRSWTAVGSLPRLRQCEHLSIVHEHLWRRILIEPPLPHVFDDADDLLRREFHATVQMHELPHRVLVAEQSLHDETVDDDDRRRGGIVARVEPASGDQPHAHRLQVVVADGADLRIVRVPAHLVRRASRWDERAELIDEAQQRARRR